MSKISLGRKGENIAEKYLVDQGYKILDRNFQNRFGEIDIVAEDKDTLVFVEVKTRFSEKFGRAEEAVTAGKIKKIIKAGQFYRILNKDLPESERIDVVAIDFDNDKLERVELIKNVIG